jgi:hypothetical protein
MKGIQPILYTILGLEIILASGCATKNRLPTEISYSQQTNTRDVATDWDIIMSSDHFERRPDQKRLKHLVEELSELRSQQNVSSGERFLYDTMIASTSATIYDFDISQTRTGIELAIFATQRSLQEGKISDFSYVDELNKGRPAGKEFNKDEVERKLQEDLKTYKITKQYIMSVSPKTGRPSDQMAEIFNKRMEEERARWTTRGEYNNHGFFDEMEAIDLNMILRSAERMYINGSHIGAIALCELMKKNQKIKRSYLYPKALLTQAEAYKRMVEDTEAHPVEMITIIEKKKPFQNTGASFADYLIHGLEEAKKIPGAPLDKYNKCIEYLQKPIMGSQRIITGNEELPATSESMETIIEQKKIALVEAMQLQQRLNLYTITQRYGDSPEGEIARAEIMLLDAYRKRDERVREKLLE